MQIRTEQVTSSLTGAAQLTGTKLSEIDPTVVQAQFIGKQTSFHALHSV